ncbi:hypothetical protein ADIAL_2107 [Alkalibacterium sp. AK22]|uniref:hypothetical protein n=1 Tax=Alkalibacterium sp. AK22 TaxID=1229520 RepID=UPI00044D7059|nr:hypothetical protein [Alkalibacterium sp. AK22]EXJ22521.1 hypothetical protein ADIAL_2107 [Alkalibacterium sp. AK22]
MSSKRYRDIKSKVDKQEELSTEEHHELLKYEEPEYYDKLTNILDNWEDMDEEVFQALFRQLNPQEQVYVMDHVNTWEDGLE